MLRYLLYNLIISFVKEFVNMAVNYRKTLISCYLGFITQAIAANFAPLLFLTFHNGYGIPFGKIALISSVFFVTQLIIDVLCARFADKIGYRKCVIGSQVFSGTYRACFSARTASQSVFRNNYKHGNICNGKRSDRGTCKSDS